MSARDNILARLRQNTRETYDMPDLKELQPTVYDDPVAEFKLKTTTTAGAQLIEAHHGDDLDALVRRAYPDARIVASNVTGITAQLNPDTVSQAQELAAADVGVLQGAIGVAENACIWIPQTMKERAVCFASQQLVIFLNDTDVVSNMHQAYARIAQPGGFAPYPFGTFISGPSKTADIEGALVYGAQAARAVTVVLMHNA